VSIKDKLRPFFDPKIVTFNGILKKLNNGNIIDKIPISKGEKSYTINKEKIYICLKDEHKRYYSENMLIYVILHEIGHVLCDSQGHTEEWRIIFEALQEYAKERGFWNAREPIINNYCEIPNDTNDTNDTNDDN
jgi:Zn-dependent peptidase ImmA (M78 family)